MTITSEKELGKALKENEVVIEIANDELGKKVIRIKATGKVAWAFALAALAIAVPAAISAFATAGVGAVASGLTATGAVAVLGAGATTSAIAIAVAAGGVGALNKLRKYRLEKKDGNRVILHRT